MTKFSHEFLIFTCWKHKLPMLHVCFISAWYIWMFFMANILSVSCYFNVFFVLFVDIFLLYLETNKRKKWPRLFKTQVCVQFGINNVKSFVANIFPNNIEKNVILRRHSNNLWHLGEHRGSHEIFPLLNSDFNAFDSTYKVMVYSSIVQPCHHLPHVATGSLNVATTTIS